MFIVFGIITLFNLIVLMKNYLLKGISFKSSKMGNLLFVSLCISTFIFILSLPI